MKSPRLASVPFVVLLVSCGGAAPQTSPGAGESSVSTRAASAHPPADFRIPAEKTFLDLSPEEKKAVMKNEILPTMGGEMTKFGGLRFANVTCVTCHGKGIEGTFAMPNPELPHLSAKDGFKRHLEKTPEITKFMMQTVSPGMAKMLHLPPFDPQTRKGFGCHNCHIVEEG